MDPIFPLAMLAAIAGAATLGWRSARRGRRSGDLRTSWIVICYRCDRVHRRPEPDCEECRSAGMMPLSKYQAENGGTGFWLDKDGPLVSSLCEGEWTPSDDESNRPHGIWHAPLFDLDLPARLAPHRVGAILTIEKTVPERAYEALHGIMEELKLVSSAYAARPFEDRYAAGIEGYRVSAPVAARETAFRLSVPARLVPSSTQGHFHLYLETRLRWDDYLGLMRRMVDAGLLEKDWVDMNERRRMAMLRKPGIKK